MTNDLNAVISDAITGEVIVRELTDNELLALQQSKAEADSERLAYEAKITARESALAKLAALGLTEAEIAAL
jgi:DNA-binding NarL/FixJ family response regulator